MIGQAHEQACLVWQMNFPKVLPSYLPTKELPWKIRLCLKNSLSPGGAGAS